MRHIYRVVKAKRVWLTCGVTLRGQRAKIISGTRNCHIVMGADETHWMSKNIDKNVATEERWGPH